MTTTLEKAETKIAIDLKEIATDVVRRAMKGGATAAECVVREGDEFSTVVRLGQVETLKESGSRAIGVRVFFGQRAANTYSSDFSSAGIERMLKSALEAPDRWSYSDLAIAPPKSDEFDALDLYHATTGGEAALKRKYRDDAIRAHGHAHDEAVAAE